MLDQNRFVYDADERFLDRLNPQTREQVRRQLGEKPIPIEQQLEMGFDDVWDQWEGAAGGRIRIQLAPQGLQWCSDEALELLADKARERQVGLHMHLLETCAQRWYAANRCPEGVLRHLGSVGMLGSLLTLGHGVWLKDDDIEVMAESGTRLCYNPSSNLRLKSGIAPILPVTRAGVVVAIGIDEAGINDDRDMFQELRLAVTLQRLPGVGSRPLSTAEGFRMATENGAATTRFGSMLGVLSVGSAADVVVLDWEGICRPYLDPRSALMDAFVRRSRTSLTQMVMVGGEVIYKDGEFTRVDRNEALSRIATELTPPTSPEDDARRELADSLLDPVVEFYKSAPGQQALDPFYVFNSRE
jgi:cytosine/adenosine deaminase-related metal-dependent hydrolase